MKKWFVYLCMGMILCFPLHVLASETGEVMVKEDEESIEVISEEGLIPGARSGILMDPTTGEILFEKNSHERFAVASMTKMMSQLLILEAIEAGTLSFDEMLTVSNNAAGMGGSQIWLQAGEVMSVRDLMKGISMASANDATVALAERISGTEQAFVDAMNEKAASLGLQDTHFMNSTGLDEDNHYSSAYDLAIIAQALMKHEEIFQFSSVYEDYLRQDTETPFWLVNTNKLVRTYPGADGLKTGHTDNALYCMAVTAKRDHMRLLAVVLGEENSKIRNSETAALLDYGFQSYTVQLIKQKGEVVGEVVLEKGNKDKVSLVTTSDIGILLKKGEQVDQVQTELKLSEIKLPVTPGDIVASLIVTQQDGTKTEYPLTVQEEVEAISFWKLYLRTLGDLLMG